MRLSKLTLINNRLAIQPDEPVSEKPDPCHLKKGVNMPIKIHQPSIIEPAGNKFKRIEEYVGRVNSKTSGISIARIMSPPGYIDPGQKSDFTEYRVVIKGALQVKTSSELFIIYAGEAIIVSADDQVQYSTPSDDGAEFISVCVPAFSQDSVHREI